MGVSPFCLNMGGLTLISITKLLCQNAEHYGDGLRYHHGSRGAVHGVSDSLGPVVVWNCTRTCNLNCLHCYARSEKRPFNGELDTNEARHFIDDLAAFRVPVLLFSGGEPLMREDIHELVEYAASRGLRATISTNGTLIDGKTARKFKKAGISYVGVSLDGIGTAHDQFRGQKGAFDEALTGINHCLSAGLKVGLRFTVTRHNLSQVPDMFRLIKEEGIPRVCFYHLVYSGRGIQIIEEDITPGEKRALLDLIAQQVQVMDAEGTMKEVLTVDNHADGVYLYLKMKAEDHAAAERIWRLISMNGGNRSGMAISAVDSQGFVHPDQFTPDHAFGNVRERSFGEIWTDTSHPLLRGLKDRKPLLKGRCGRCRWLSVCNGNLRSRAEAVYGDFWASDPGCYLMEEEIILE